MVMGNGPDRRTKGKCAVAIVCCALFWLAGCAEKHPLPPPQVAPVPVGYLEHTVKYPGESLAMIAAWYTGKATNWNAIARENPGIKPDKIRKGQVIRIPRSLVIKDEPLPPRAVKAAEKPKVGSEPVNPEVVTHEVAPTASGLPAANQPAGTADAARGVSNAAVPAPTAVAPVAAPAGPAAPPSGDDAEREKLLEELLK